MGESTSTQAAQARTGISDLVSPDYSTPMNVTDVVGDFVRDDGSFAVGADVSGGAGRDAVIKARESFVKANATALRDVSARHLSEKQLTVDLVLQAVIWLAAAFNSFGMFVSSWEGCQTDPLKEVALRTFKTTPVRVRRRSSTHARSP